MSFNFFQWALNFSEIHGYVLIFLIMVIEGPVITSASAFAASLGYFNIIIIFFLSLFGDITSDVLFYSLGRLGRKSLIEKYDFRFGLKKKTIKKLEKNLKNHLGKTLTIVKPIPGVSTLTLLLTGAVKIPPAKFLLYSVATTLPRTIFFTALGYYFGVLLNSSLKYLNLGQYILVLAAILLIGLVYVLRKLYIVIFKKYI